MDPSGRFAEVADRAYAEPCPQKRHCEVGWSGRSRGVPSPGVARAAGGSVRSREAGAWAGRSRAQETLGKPGAVGLTIRHEKPPN